jgi:hypothetical protein
MRQSNHTNHRHRGTSLAEIAMAIAVLTLVVTALVGSSLADARLAEEKVEQALLTTACRNLIELFDDETMRRWSRPTSRARTRSST